MLPRPRLRSQLIRRTTAAIAAAALGLTLASCGQTSDDKAGNKDSGSSDVTLTVYTDQHAELVQTLTDAYTEQTGVKFKIQNDATVGQIEAEGKASPADLFISEDPSPAAQLAKKGLFEPVAKETIDQVRPGLNPQDGLWVAYAARSRVIFYNPSLIKEDELPKSLLDITDAKYKGKFAYAPSGGFVATTQYLISTNGEESTKAFLEDIKANGVNELKNGNVRDTIDAGRHAMGLSNHYYWWIKANEVGGPDKMKSKIYNFPGEDAGNLVLSSGAGILKSSDQKAEAAKFLEWLTSPEGGQKIFASDDLGSNGAQYPVAPGMSSGVAGSLDDIKSPKVDMSIFADSTQAEELLKTLGMAN